MKTRTNHDHVLPLAVLSICMLGALTGCMTMGRQKIVPESVATCRQLSRDGVSAMELGHSAEACSLFSRAVEMSPTDIDARRQLAEALWQEGHRKDALIHMEAAVQLDGHHGPTIVRAGEMLLASGSQDRALQRAEQAIGLDATLASAWALRGRVYRIRGDQQQALADMQQALNYASQDAEVLLEIAEVQNELQRHQQSLTTLHHLLNTYPPGEEPQRALWLEGLAYGALARPQDAVESLAAASRRGPPRADLMFVLAQAEVAAGRQNAAVATARQALALDKGHTASRHLLAQLTARGVPAEDSTIRR